MTDTLPPSPITDSTEKLNSQTVLTAVTALCGSDRTVAAQLQKGFLRLVASEDWSTEIKRLVERHAPLLQ
jgi:hypothetical protein